MSQYRSDRRRSARPAVRSADCPCVADLIEFAAGTAGHTERKRVEAHLKDTGCSYCQSWIAKAGDQPVPSATAAIRSSSRALANPPPKADNPQWQRQAFLDLEKRLQELEEK